MVEYAIAGALVAAIGAAVFTTLVRMSHLRSAHSRRRRHLSEVAPSEGRDNGGGWWGRRFAGDLTTCVLLLPPFRCLSLPTGRLQLKCRRRPRVS